MNNNQHTITNRNSKRRRRQKNKRGKKPIPIPHYAVKRADRKTIFIGGLFFQFKKEELLAFFGEYGKVFSIDINKPRREPKKHQTKRILGSGIMVVENTAFDRIITANPICFKGRLLDCKEYIWDRALRDKKAEEVTLATLNLFCLPSHLSDAILFQYFSKFGEVKNAYILPEHGSEIGKMTDKAKIIFKDIDTAVNVEMMALDGQLRIAGTCLDKVTRGKIQSSSSKLSSLNFSRSNTQKTGSVISIFESEISCGCVMTPSKKQLKITRKWSCQSYGDFLTSAETPKQSPQPKSKFFSIENIIDSKAEPKLPQIEKVKSFDFYSHEIMNFHSLRTIKTTKSSLPKSKFSRMNSAVNFNQQKKSSFKLKPFIELQKNGSAGKTPQSTNSLYSLF